MNLCDFISAVTLGHLLKQLYLGDVYLKKRWGWGGDNDECEVNALQSYLVGRNQWSESYRRPLEQLEVCHVVAMITQGGMVYLWEFQLASLERCLWGPRN